MLLSSSDDVPTELTKTDTMPSRDSESNIFGEEYYSNPFTNTEYSKTLKDLNVDQFIYNLAANSDKANATAGKSLVASSKSIPMNYEGKNVIVESITMQNLSVESLQGMEAPQYFTEPGYLISFLVATNDPLMALKIYAKGQGETGYSVADYSFRKMAMLGLGMTLGEAEELIYTEEGQTSRDISGTPSLEHPYLKRYKHLPSGEETDYEKYKGTENDTWIVAAYTPKLYPQFNTLFFDIYNGNETGPRLIHYLEIKRLIIVLDKVVPEVPPYNQSVLSLTQPTTTPLTAEDLTTPIDTSLIETPPVSVATSSYASKKMRRIDGNSFMSKPSANIYSINKQQQDTKLFKDIMDVNHQMFNDMIAARFASKKIKLFPNDFK